MLSIRRERENVIIIRQWEKKKWPQCRWLAREAGEWTLANNSKKRNKKWRQTMLWDCLPSTQTGCCGSPPVYFYVSWYFRLASRPQQITGQLVLAPNMSNAAAWSDAKHFWVWCWNHPTSITSCKRTRSVNSGTDQGWGCFGWRDGSHTGKKNFKLYNTGKLRCIVNVSEHVMGRLTQVKVFCCA